MEAIIFYSRNTCCVYWNVSLHVIWFFWTYQSHLPAAVSQYNGKFHSTLKNHLRPKLELKWRRVWKNVSLKCQTNIASLWKNGVRSWDSWSAEAWLRVCVWWMDGWIGLFEMLSFGGRNLSEDMLPWVCEVEFERLRMSTPDRWRMLRFLSVNVYFVFSVGVCTLLD